MQALLDGTGLRRPEQGLSSFPGQPRWKNQIDDQTPYAAHRIFDHAFLDPGARSRQGPTVALGQDSHHGEHATAKSRGHQVRGRKALPLAVVVRRCVGLDAILGRTVHGPGTQRALVFDPDLDHRGSPLFRFSRLSRPSGHPYAGVQCAPEFSIPLRGGFCYGCAALPRDGMPMQAPSSNTPRDASTPRAPRSPSPGPGHATSSALADDLDAALLRFGLEAYRPGQREAIEFLLDEGQALLVAPTGGGKSLSYQVPALLLEGTSLVISPLVSLMHDQVSALEALGIPATFLASTLAPHEMRERLEGLSSGRYKLVYVAPERFAVPDFAPLLAAIDCPLVAIDEAHCISEWGHDFRPDYLQIGRVLEIFPKARVLACTATATPVVRDEIIERLGLPADTRQLIHGFARPNLALRVKEVSSQAQRNGWVDDVLAETLEKPGAGHGAAIVYSPTRKAAEKESARLEARGWQAGVYHAGLEPEARDASHRAFSAGKLEVVVATNAFGMGIDRADVRAVIHLAPPGSIEAYYQEVGRAGRDGRDAVGLMILSPGDMPRRRHLIESDRSGPAPSPEAVQHKWGLFLELMRFAEGGSCRHDTVLRYFDDEDETLSGCGRCDVCRHLAAGGDASQDFDDEAVSLIVRKALSGIARIHGQYGLSAAVALLRGVSDDRLERQGLQHTTTFGVLAEFGEDWLTRLLRRCVTAGWVDFFGGDRPVVALTEDGIATMKGERPVRLLLPPLKDAARRKPSRSRAGSAPAVELDPSETALFEALRAYRMEVARGEGVPPYVVASDRALRDIARLRPTDFESLQLANGIGPNKAARYGDGLLSVVREHFS